MPAYFNLALDTQAPQGATLTLAGGAAAVASADTTADFATTDADTTGYQIKVWGDIAGGPADEATAAWEAYTASRAITLTAGDGDKTVSGKIRDSAGNETAVLTDTITLDTSVPVVTVGAPNPSKISKVAGYNVSVNTFQSDSPFEAYSIRVVPAAGSIHTDGVQIGEANGSTNLSGAAGGYPADTGIQFNINGADLEAAAPGDGTKIIKVFVQDAVGNWST